MNDKSYKNIPKRVLIVNQMDKKQTAVEWLIEQLIPKDQHNGINDIIQEAKQMEKDQIIDAHIEGQRVFDNHPHTQWTTDQAEQYYKETYGGNNKTQDLYNP